MNGRQGDSKYILGTYHRLEHEISHIRDGYIYTSDGKTYLDMFSGVAVNSLGYDVEQVEQMKKKMDRYLHLSNYFVDEDRTLLAKYLIECSIGGKVFFSNSGAEANEGALKLVKKWGNCLGKTEILSAVGSFHGRTLGVLGVTGQEKYQQAFAPLLPGMKYFRYNDGLSLEQAVSPQTAAVFVEIIQGEGGVVPMTPDFARTIMALKRKFGFLLVVDEIQTGLLRCGKVFAYQDTVLEPDIITVAKALGGGLPLGAFIVTEQQAKVLQPGDHGSTFGGNPVACTGGRFLMEKIIGKEFQGLVAENSAYLMKQLLELANKNKETIRAVRGRGYMIGIEIEKANDIKKKMQELGVLINVTAGTVIRLLPPLTIKREDIDVFLQRLEIALGGI